MDEQLRVQPDDVVTLLRAGRLSPERVAMAAYLGDERALASGVAPWEPPEPLPEESWPARTLLCASEALLSSRELVWLLCLLAERVEVGIHDEKSARLLKLARDWCRGLTKAEAIPPEAKGLVAIVDSVRDPRAMPVHVVLHAAWSAQDAEAGADAVFTPQQRALEVVSISREDPGEQAWQAQAIADVVLDPAWPPWEE